MYSVCASWWKEKHVNRVLPKCKLHTCCSILLQFVPLLEILVKIINPSIIGYWRTWYAPCQLREWGDMSIEGCHLPSCPAAKESASFFSAGRELRSCNVCPNYMHSLKVLKNIVHILPLPSCCFSLVIFKMQCFELFNYWLLTANLVSGMAVVVCML